jgi:hypothetical protein
VIIFTLHLTSDFFWKHGGNEDDGAIRIISNSFLEFCSAEPRGAR